MMASLLVSSFRLFLILWVCIHLIFAQERDFSIAAYLPDYRSYISVNATAPFLTDLLLFSISPDSGGCCLSEDHYRIARQAQSFKQQYSNARLRLWVTVGGGGRSEGFRNIVSDETGRARFVDSMVHLCKREGLDGIDFDWEIPKTRQELQAYSTLLLDMSKILHGQNLLISVALHARQFMPPQVYEAMDRIHFMAYDLEASHVAAYETVVKAVAEFVEYACPISKMVLGLAAYGRHYQNPGFVKTFSELMDESSNAAASQQEWNGYRYDSPQSIRRKVEFATQQGMKGVFFWELGQDKQHAELGPGGILLEAAATESDRKSVV